MVSGINYFLMSTGNAVNREKSMSVSFVDTKATVECFLVGSGLDFTILRPGFFYSNLFDPCK